MLAERVEEHHGALNRIIWEPYHQIAGFVVQGAQGLDGSVGHAKMEKADLVLKYFLTFYGSPSEKQCEMVHERGELLHFYRERVSGLPPSHHR